MSRPCCGKTFAAAQFAAAGGVLAQQGTPLAGVHDVQQAKPAPHCTCSWCSCCFSTVDADPTKLGPRPLPGSSTSAYPVGCSYGCDRGNTVRGDTVDQAIVGAGHCDDSPQARPGPATSLGFMDVCALLCNMEHDRYAA